MMQHHSKATTFVFVKKNIPDNFPTSIEDMNIRLEQFPDEQLVEKVMRFG